MLHQALNQARDMARGLYPVELEGTSLMSSLQELTQRTETLMKVSCKFHCPVPIRMDDNNIATHLYRIAQEAIHNAIKHGMAQLIEVSLIQREGNMTLIVSDDGNGLGDQEGNVEGIGLQIMKYRARMIGASLYFESNLPQGTLLICSLKVPTAKQEKGFLKLAMVQNSQGSEDRI